MLFCVECGKYTREVEALNFEHAQKLFLDDVFDELENPKLGGIMIVKVVTQEVFFNTSEKVKDRQTTFGTGKTMKVVCA